VFNTLRIAFIPIEPTIDRKLADVFSSPSTPMAPSRIFANWPLCGPGPYDLASTDAPIAGYHAVSQKVRADAELRKQAEKKGKLLIGMEASENGINGTWNDVAIDFDVLAADCGSYVLQGRRQC
jgi:hypothetical protein